MYSEGSGHTTQSVLRLVLKPTKAIAVCQDFSPCLNPGNVNVFTTNEQGIRTINLDLIFSNVLANLHVEPRPIWALV